MGFISRIYQARYILFSLVKQDLKNRYRNSFLGLGWSILTPLGLVLIIGGVYSQIFNQSMADFVPFLFSGLIPWLYFVQCADMGTMSFISAEGYIKQTKTPIEIFPVRIALGAFVNLGLSMVAFYAVYLFLKPSNFDMNMLLVFVSLILWIILGVAVSTISGIINTYLRDFAPLQSLILQAIFYGTPIIFKASFLKKGQEWIYQWNPFYYLIELIREPMLGDKMENSHVWWVATGIILGLFLIALILLKIIGRKITFRL